MIKEEEENDEEDEEESAASSSEASEDVASSSGESDPLTAPPLRKRARIDDVDNENDVEPIAQTAVTISTLAEDNAIARRRAHLKDKWPEKATDKNLNAVEVAVNSLTYEDGERISPNCMIDRLTLLQEHLRLQLSSFTKQQWDDWLENRSALE